MLRRVKHDITKKNINGLGRKGHLLQVCPFDAFLPFPENWGKRLKVHIFNSSVLIGKDKEEERLEEVSNNA